MHFKDIGEVGRLLRSGEISSVALTGCLLRRIEKLDPHLHAYATVMAESAMKNAELMDEELSDGRDRGPLHGIPVAVKDLCFTKGVPTMGGLSARRDFVPDQDATVVRKLEAAGAIILGKLNLTEGALIGYHKDFDIPVNPWGAEYMSGFSSSGSGVAVAAGLCFAATGTDTGGSIRIPAMANGVVGLKPTYGRVSRHGVLDLAETFDHVGPLARRTADAAMVLDAIAGADPKDPTSLDDQASAIVPQLGERLDGVQIGYDRDFAQLDPVPGAVAAIEDALALLETLGASIVPVTVPALPDEFEFAYNILCAAETSRAHAEYYPSQIDSYGSAFGDWLALGSTVTQEQLDDANAIRAQVAKDWRDITSGLDAFACPVSGHATRLTSSQYGDIEEITAMLEGFRWAFIWPANLAGLPTLTLPCGSQESGPPYPLQLYGSHLGERALCQIGHAYEQATSWHKLHPDCSNLEEETQS